MPKPVRTPITQALEDGVLSRRELKALMVRSDGPALNRLALWVATLLVTGSGAEEPKDRWVSLGLHCAPQPKAVQRAAPSRCRPFLKYWGTPGAVHRACDRKVERGTTSRASGESDIACDIDSGQIRFLQVTDDAQIC